MWRSSLEAYDSSVTYCPKIIFRSFLESSSLLEAKLFARFTYVKEWVSTSFETVAPFSKTSSETEI